MWWNKKKIEESLEQYAFDGYSDLKMGREVVDDCLAGQKTIKSKTKYLPPNQWQDEHPEEYNRFLYNSIFPGETISAQEIYGGLFRIGDPSVKVPDDMKYLLKDASVYRDSLKNVQVRANEEQMAHGLRGMLVEVREDIEKSFFISEYQANAFLRAHFTNIGGESAADFILLDESTMEYDLKTFSDKPVIRMLLLALDADGWYYQRVIAPQELQKFDVKHPPQDGRTKYPAYGREHRRMQRIPFVWCGARSLSGSNFDYPPLLTIANLELKLYLCMAYHSQHIYMNTQEFLFFSGMSQDFDIKKVTLGAGCGVSTRNADANCKYVSTNGVGFTAEADEINMIKEDIEAKRMSLMSAKSHQSGTVVGMVQNSQSAPLRTIVSTSGDAITQLLKYIATWMGKSQAVIDAIEYKPSERFADARVNLSEYVALCKAVLQENSVMMLEEDLYELGRESGWVTNKMTWQDFLDHWKIQKTERERENGAVTALPQNRTAEADTNEKEEKTDAESTPESR